MTSQLLKWIANGLIATVLVSTLWIAHALQPDQPQPRNFIASAVTAAAGAASAPVGVPR